MVDASNFIEAEAPPAQKKSAKATRSRNFLSKLMHAVTGGGSRNSTVLSEGPTIFGMPLEELVKNREIPIVVESCVAYLEKNGIQEGIFRLSGMLSEVDELKRKFKSPEERVDFSKIKDPNSIAVLLKQFFSQLPEPLFTFSLFDDFIEVSERIPKTLSNVPLEDIRRLLNRLPGPNKALTQYLMRFLRDLSKYSDKTKMAPSNLALVFGPNLLRSKETTAESLFGMNSSKLVEALIIHYDAIFI